MCLQSMSKRLSAFLCLFDRQNASTTAKTGVFTSDRAAALTRAAEYDRWVRAKVESSRTDTRPAIAEDEWQRIRATKLAKRQSQQDNKTP